jgi:hypothetical protein
VTSSWCSYTEGLYQIKPNRMQWGAGKQTYSSCKIIAMVTPNCYVGGCNMVKSDAAARWSLTVSKHAQSQGKTTESTVRTNTFSSTTKEQKASEFKCNLYAEWYYEPRAYHYELRTDHTIYLCFTINVHYFPK